MKMYKIICEWDMGFAELYSTKVQAQKDIDEMDWESMCDYTLDEVKEDGLVSIQEINIK